MTQHNHIQTHSFIRHDAKMFYWIVLAISILLGMFWYVNKYIYPFRAAYPQINIAMSAPTIVDLSANPEFTFAINVSGQKILAGDMYLTYDPTKIKYYKEYAYVSGISNTDSTGAPYFNSPLTEQIISGTGAFGQSLHTILLSSYSNPALPDWTTNATIQFKFKAIAPGTTSIRLTTDSKFAGLSSGNATYFDLPSNQQDAVMTIVGLGGTTASPTNGTTTLTPTSLTPTSLTPTTLTPTQSPTPVYATPTPILEDLTLDMTILFQGIVDYPKDKTKNLDVGVILQSSDGSRVDNITTTFTAQGSGLWTGTADFSQVDIADTYSVFVKGPKHLKKRFCDDLPSEANPGEYRCGRSAIVLSGASNSLDLSGVILLAGDLPVQDGIVDSVDITFIRQNFGKKDKAILERADLNYDGIVDTQDYALVLAALRFKYDEE